MKSFLIAALLSAFGFANAADVAYMPNNGGGEIVLTDEPCRNRTTLSDEARAASRHAYSTGASGASIVGCYFASERTVHVLWHEPVAQPVLRTYPLERFVPVQSVQLEPRQRNSL